MLRKEHYVYYFRSRVHSSGLSITTILARLVVYKNNEININPNPTVQFKMTS